MVVHPQTGRPDRPTVQFFEPRELVNLKVELARLLAHGDVVGVGTYFNVQFLSHDRKALLSSALFVVTHEEQRRVTNEANPYQPISSDPWTRKFAQIGEWWTAAPVEQVAAPVPDVGKPAKEPRPRKTA